MVPVLSSRAERARSLRSGEPCERSRGISRCPPPEREILRKLGMTDLVAAPQHQLGRVLADGYGERSDGAVHLRPISRASRP